MRGVCLCDCVSPYSYTQFVRGVVVLFVIQCMMRMWRRCFSTYFLFLVYTWCVPGLCFGLFCSHTLSLSVCVRVCNVAHGVLCCARAACVPARCFFVIAFVTCLCGLCLSPCLLLYTKQDAVRLAYAPARLSLC